MNTKMRNLAAAGALAVLSAVPASAAIITLDFEGVGNVIPVGNFYAAQGAIFSPATLAIVDGDAGGSGNIANEPSASTVMFFLDASNAILDFAAGFTTGFSFFYSSATAASVNVYDDVGGSGGTGNIIASLGLTAQFNDNCVGDPTGQFCNWTAVGVLFGGIAKSIDFGGTANQTAFDDITFGSDKPGAIPVPAALPLMLLALGGLGVAARRRRRT